MPPRREHPEAELGANQLDEILETEGFNQFLGEFEDADKYLEVTPQNRQEILRRFEIFQKLDEVAASIQQLAKEKNLLDGEITPEQLAAIQTELRTKITKDLKFDLLNDLAEQAVKYRQLPEEIGRWELELSGMGDKEDLRAESARLDHAISRQETKIERGEESREGMNLGREAVGIVKDLSEGLNLAEQVFVREAVVIAANYESSLGQLERIQHRLEEVDRISPNSGAITIPDVSYLREQFEEAENKQANPVEYLEALSSLGMSSRLEDVKRRQARACTEGINSVLRYSSVAAEAENKRPQIEITLSEFRGIVSEIETIRINPDLDQQVESLQEDLAGVFGIRQGMLYLQEDPTNEDMRHRVERSLAEFQTPTGKNLAPRLNFGLEQLKRVQDQVERTGVSDLDIRAVVEHGNKGLLKRIFIRNPEAKAASQAKKDKRELQGLQEDQSLVLEKIGNIQEAEAVKRRLEMEFKRSEKFLISNVHSFRDIFMKKREEAEQAINAQLAEGGSLEDAISARSAIEKLAAARQAEPGLYGELPDDDGPDEAENNLLGHRTLRGLVRDYEDLLTEKVQKAVSEALARLPEEKINSTNLSAELKRFEDGLGSLSDTPQYQAVRLQALRRLASVAGTLENGKKIAINTMLRKMRDSGFLSEGLFDLRGYTAANFIPSPEPA